MARKKIARTKKARKAGYKYSYTPGQMVKYVDKATEEAIELAVGLRDVMGWTSEHMTDTSHSIVEMSDNQGEWYLGDRALHLLFSELQGSSGSLKRTKLVKSAKAFIKASQDLRKALGAAAPNRKLWAAMRVSP